MQDSLKTRCWHNGKMHYDDFVVTSTGYVAKVQTHLDALGKFIIDQTDLEFDKKAVVMRCIGLKDKNNKLIYGGDIVILTCNREDKGGLFYQKAEIICDIVDTYSGFCVRLPNGDKASLWRCHKMEIIGNVYENPELLNENPA